MIPARSGSKGVKNKNIRTILGKPLFFYAMNAVKQAMSDDDMLLFNTDSRAYADLAEKFGARVPFLRPSELATDDSPVTDTIKHTYEYCKKKGLNFDYFAIIQPTSPLIISDDVKRGVTLINDSEIDSVISITKTEHSPLWCNVLDKKREMHNFIPPEIAKLHRQALPEYYRLTGSICIADWKKFRNNGFCFFMPNSRPLVLPNDRALDIDSPLDIEFAEFFLSRNQKS